MSIVNLPLPIQHAVNGGAASPVNTPNATGVLGQLPWELWPLLGVILVVSCLLMFTGKRHA